MKWIASIAGMALALFAVALVLVLGFGIRDPFHGSIPVMILMYGLGIGTFSAIFRAMSRKTSTVPRSQAYFQNHIQTPLAAPFDQDAEKGFPLDQAEEKAYEIALTEVESNSPKKGIWGKAFATEPNDDNRRQALYIKLRVRQILPQAPNNVYDYEIAEDGKAKLDCPQCGKEIESGEQDKLPDIVCPECGQRIRLVAE